MGAPMGASGHWQKVVLVLPPKEAKIDKDVVLYPNKPPCGNHSATRAIA